VFLVKYTAAPGSVIRRSAQDVSQHKSMATLTIIVLSLLILFVMLSQFQMRKFLQSEGELESGKSIWFLGSYAFIEAEYVKLTKEKFGKIGNWFWLEVFSFIGFIALFIIFAWTVG